MRKFALPLVLVASLGVSSIAMAATDSTVTGAIKTLDAKNHFVRASGMADFEAPDGRPYGNFHGYEGHPLRPAFERVFRYLALDPERSIGRFTTPATPPGSSPMTTPSRTRSRSRSQRARARSPSPALRSTARS